jgi:hypothetical protein
MTTTYYFKAVYTKIGVGTAPSVAPTCTVVDSANNILANAQATTALSNLPGVYMYSYSGADDLDLVAKFTTTDVTVDQQDLYSYTPPQIANNLGTKTSALSTASALSTLQGNVTTILADYARRTGDYATVTALSTLQGNVTTILADYARRTGDYATVDALAALQGNVTTILTNYATALALSTLQGNVTTILADYARRTGDYATVTALSTLQGNVTTILTDYARRTGDYATVTALSALQGNVTTILADYARRTGDYATVTALSALQGNVTTILADYARRTGDYATVTALATLQGNMTTILADYARRTGDYSTLTAGEVWEVPTSGLTMTGSIGKWLVQKLDAAISSVLTVMTTLVNLVAGLSAVQVTYSGPMAEGGDIELIQGDSYYAAEGRALSWTSEAWPSLAGATITFKCNGVTQNGSASGTGTQIVSVELSDAQTNAISKGVSEFHVLAVLSNTHKVTLVKAELHLTENKPEEQT